MRGHNNHPEKYNSVYKLNHDGLSCQFCGKECKNRNSLCGHERLCKENPNRQESPFVKYNAEREQVWNKGLTKDTDARVAKSASTLTNSYVSGKLTPYWSGKKHTEDEKLKISNSRKDYLSKHPDKVPYLLNHSSKTSYPEQYFIDLFAMESIDLGYHLQISKYELDFYNESKKIDFEVDGDQHFLDKKIYASDRERDKYLISLGWTVKRIRWSDYQKLSFDEKKSIIDDIRTLLGS